MTNENWGPQVRATGARFVAIAPADPPQSGRNDFQLFKQNILPSFRITFDHIATLVERGHRPVLAYRTNMLGALCAAERFGLLNARVALQPSAVRSFLRPPWPLTSLASGRYTSAGRKWIVPAVYAAGEIFSRYRLYTEQFRRSVGLRPKRLLRDPPRVENLFLMLCPRWFCIPQADWPSHISFLGFPYGGAGSDGDVPLPQDRPIVFTPGTGVTDIEPWIRRARQAAHSLGRPALVLSRELSARPRESHVAYVPFAELGRLLPHCSAIVHHGGVGTAAEAVRAGVPQLIIADRFDQPDNAVRVAQLGLGGAILNDRVTDSLVAETLERVLNSTHIKQQLATAKQLVASQDAIDTAAQLLCELSGKSLTASLHADIAARPDRIA